MFVEFNGGSKIERTGSFIALMKDTTTYKNNSLFIIDMIECELFSFAMIGWSEIAKVHSYLGCPVVFTNPTYFLSGKEAQFLVLRT